MTSFEKITCQADVNMKAALQDPQVNRYWVFKELKIPVSASKNTVAFWFKGPRIKENIYAKFEIKVHVDHQMVGDMARFRQFVTVTCNGEDITDFAEFDACSADNRDILCFCAYYFFSRF